MPSNLDFDRWEACRVRLNAYCSSKVAKSSVTCGRVPDPNYRLQAKALIDLFRSICAFGKWPKNRLIGQVLHQPNTPKCSLKLIHQSRIGGHQSEFFRWENPQTLSAHSGAGSDYLASGRTRSYNPSVNSRMVSPGVRMFSTE